MFYKQDAKLGLKQLITKWEEEVEYLKSTDASAIQIMWRENQLNALRGNDQEGLQYMLHIRFERIQYLNRISEDIDPEELRLLINECYAMATAITERPSETAIAVYEEVDDE